MKILSGAAATLALALSLATLGANAQTRTAAPP